MQVKRQSFSHSKWQSCLPFAYHHLTSSFAEPSRVTWTFSSVNLAARAAAQVLPSMAKTWVAPSSAQSLAKGAYAPHPTSNTMASSPRTALTESPCAFPTTNVWTSRCSNVTQTHVIIYNSDYPPSIFCLHPSMCSSNIFHMYTYVYIIHIFLKSHWNLLKHSTLINPRTSFDLAALDGFLDRPLKRGEFLCIAGHHGIAQQTVAFTNL